MELFIRVQHKAVNPAAAAPLFLSNGNVLPPEVHLLTAGEPFSLNLTAVLPDVFDEDATIVPLTLPPLGSQFLPFGVEWVNTSDASVFLLNDTNMTDFSNATMPDEGMFVN